MDRRRARELLKLKEQGCEVNVSVKPNPNTNNHEDQQGTVYRDLGDFHEWRGSGADAAAERTGQSQVRDAIAKYRERRENAAKLFGVQDKRDKDKRMLSSNTRFLKQGPECTNKKSEGIKKRLGGMTVTTVKTLDSEVTSSEETSDPPRRIVLDTGRTSTNARTSLTVTSTSSSRTVKLGLPNGTVKENETALPAEAVEKKLIAPSQKGKENERLPKEGVNENDIALPKEAGKEKEIEHSKNLVGEIEEALPEEAVKEKEIEKPKELVEEKEKALIKEAVKEKEIEKSKELVEENEKVLPKQAVKEKELLPKEAVKEKEFAIPTKTLKARDLTLPMKTGKEKERTEGIEKEASSSSKTTTTQDKPAPPYGYIPWSNNEPQFSYVPWGAEKASASNTVSGSSNATEEPEIEPGEVPDSPDERPVENNDMDRVDRVFRHLEEEDRNQKDRADRVFRLLEEEDSNQKYARHDKPVERNVTAPIDRFRRKENLLIHGRGIREQSVLDKRYLAGGEGVDIDKTPQSSLLVKSPKQKQYIDRPLDDFANRSNLNRHKEKDAPKSTSSRSSSHERAHRRYPSSDHPPSDRPLSEHLPSSDRRPSSERRPPSDRGPSSDRPSSGHHPSSGRSSSDRRPSSDRPSDRRPSSDRPHSDRRTSSGHPPSDGRKRKLVDYLAKKKSRIHRKDEEEDRHRRHSPKSPKLPSRQDSRHGAEQEYLDDRSRLEELNKLLIALVEKTESVYPVKRLTNQKTSEGDLYQNISRHIKDIEQLSTLRREESDDIRVTENGQQEIDEPEREGPTEVMTDYDKLLKDEVERKKRKKGIEEMLLRAGDESVHAYRESVEGRPPGLGSMQNLDNYPYPSNDMIDHNPSRISQSPPPGRGPHSNPMENLPHGVMAPGNPMLGPMGPIVMRPPMLPFQPLVVLPPGIPIIPQRVPLPLQSSPFVPSPGNPIAAGMAPPVWHSSTSLPTSGSSTRIGSKSLTSTGVTTTTSSTTRNSSGNQLEKEPPKPLMSIDLTQSPSPPPIKSEPLSARSHPHEGPQFQTPIQQRESHPANQPRSYTAQRFSNYRAHLENRISNEKRRGERTGESVDKAIPLGNDAPQTNNPSGHPRDHPHGHPPGLIPGHPPAGAIPPPTQPQLMLYNNMLIPVQPLDLPMDPPAPIQPYGVPEEVQEVERGRHNLTVHDPYKNVPPRKPLPPPPAPHQQDALKKPHKKVRRGMGGKTWRTPEERQQMKNEQKNQSNMNSPWFDAECHLAAQRKKQVIHKMRNRMALQRKQGNHSNAEETLIAIKGVQNAYTNFIRGKKAIYIKDLDEKGEVEYICKLTLNNLVDSVVNKENADKRQVRIEREVEKQTQNKISKMKKMEEEKMRRIQAWVEGRSDDSYKRPKELDQGQKTKDSNVNHENDSSDSSTSDADDSDDDDDRYGGDGGWSRWRKEIHNEPDAAVNSKATATVGKRQVSDAKRSKAAPRRKSRWDG